MNTHSLSLRIAGAVAAAALVLSMFAIALTTSAPKAHAASLADQILCYVDQQMGSTSPFDFSTDYCGTGVPQDPGPLPQCFDTIDNDHDGLTDLADPDCDSPVDTTESGSMGTSTGTTTAQCADTLDNDHDGVIDLNDPDCSSASDTTESGTMGTGTPATTTHMVSIYKYIGGNQATSGNTGDASFMFSSNWNNQGGSGTGSGTFSLGSGNSYSIASDALNNGSSYSFHETTSDMASSSNTLPAGAQCQAGMWRLAGYRTGTTLANAQSAALSTSTPSFSNLTANEHVIVVNEDCDTVGTTTDATLHVDSIEAQKTTAVADGTYDNGWRYVFHVTAPNNEKNLSMRFSDWFVSSSSSSTIPAANNMRISSAQASSTSPVTLTAANAYSTPPLVLVSDLNPSMPGRQADIVVEVKIPSGTSNDTYTTFYGVQTLP